MTKQLKNPFKHTKFKAMFFFLVLATLIWVLTKFSKQYTASATATINFVNVPKSTLVTDDNLDKLSFDLSASGFEFLFYKLKSPSIDVDIEKYYEEGANSITIPKSDLFRLISSNLSTNLEIMDLSVEQLQVSLDKIVSKKVAVTSKTEFSYKDGFRPVNSVKIEPDSIIIAGPSIYLDTINSVGTQLVIANELDKTTSMIVKIQSFENSKLSFSDQEVTVSVSVAEFSQKEMVLEIELINIPEEAIIKLIPNVVTVLFDASVEDFKKITTGDFKLICDFALRNTDENFMIPTLVQSPPGIYNIEFDTKKIDYLIFK